MSGHFGTGTEVSWDTSDLGPNCLGSEVSEMSHACTRITQFLGKSTYSALKVK